MSRPIHAQQGAILVLTAFLLPFIIVFTGLAVDFGSAYVRRSQLQNAADAAVLAGAYHLDDNQADGVVLQYLQTNLGLYFKNYSYQTGDDFPNEYETLNYHTDKQKDELDVTLRSSVEASFLKLFDINAIPVYATAKARVSETKMSVNDDIFNYAMVAAHESSKDYDIKNWQHWDDSSIWIHHEDNIIDGNILTNGKISLDQNQFAILRGIIYASANVKNQGKTYTEEYWQHNLRRKKVFEPDVWGMYGWPANNQNDPNRKHNWLWEWIKYFLGIDNEREGMNYYTFMNTQNGDFTTERQIEESDYKNQYDGKWQDITNTNLVKYRSSVDVSIDSNPGIKSFINKYKNMSVTDREANHVFYDDSSNVTIEFSKSSAKGYPNISTGSASDSWSTIPIWQRYYRIIIVPHGLKVSIDHLRKPKDNEFAILIALDGDVNIPLSSDFNGMIYAPNGTVFVNGEDNITFTGSIVAQKIQITNTVHFIYKNFFDDNQNDSGSNEKKVTLIK